MKPGTSLTIFSCPSIYHSFQEEKPMWLIPWLLQLVKIPLPPKLRYDIEVRYRASIPENVKNWKVFENDIEIKRFLETVEEFSALHIDQDSASEEDSQADTFLNKIVDNHIVQLPRNHIPKGLVPLERLFENNDVALKGQISKDNTDTTECNIGTEKEPKLVKLLSSLTREHSAEYDGLSREFADVFAWTYEDLKTYDTTVIEHKIPLK
jgi:hypothetical protein